MLRRFLLLICLSVFLNSCLFSSDEQVSSKHLTKDFYLEDHSLIQKVRNANTDAVIVDATQGAINSIGWNENYILIQQNLNSNNGPQEINWYVIDLRNYIPSAWDKTENIYKCASSQEFDTKRKALGVPDSIELMIADIPSPK